MIVKVRIPVCLSARLCISMLFERVCVCVFQSVVRLGLCFKACDPTTLKTVIKKAHNHTHTHTHVQTDRRSQTEGLHTRAFAHKPQTSSSFAHMHTNKRTRKHAHKHTIALALLTNDKNVSGRSLIS